MLIATRNHIEFAVMISRSAYYGFMNSEVREILNLTNYGKGDTLGLDSIPEIILNDAVKGYDKGVIFVTEETDEQTIASLPPTYDPNMQPLVFVADPADRSKFLKKFILHLIKKEYESKIDGKELDSLASECELTIRELWSKHNVVKEWENICESPATITGATTAVSCVLRGESICSVIANFITGEMLLSCGFGVFYIPIEGKKNDRIILQNLCTENQALKFKYPDVKSPDEENSINRRFVTFLGKAGYREHFEASKIILGKDGVDKHLHHQEPGGPSRPLYLSSLNDNNPAVGFIIANGEKITEWIHWLSIVKNSKNLEGKRNLRMFEIFTGSNMAKNGIPMSVTTSLSIFRKHHAFGKFLDINKISQFENPSHFRSMLVVCHRKNTWLTGIMRQKKFRDISDYF